jgi:hypothetical protein
MHDVVHRHIMRCRSPDLPRSAAGLTEAADWKPLPSRGLRRMRRPYG